MKCLNTSMSYMKQWFARHCTSDSKAQWFLRERKIKFLKTSNKKKILNVDRKNRHAIYREMKIRMSTDFLLEKNGMEKRVEQYF